MCWPQALDGGFDSWRFYVSIDQALPRTPFVVHSEGPVSNGFRDQSTHGHAYAAGEIQTARRSGLDSQNRNGRRRRLRRRIIELFNPSRQRRERVQRVGSSQPARRNCNRVERVCHCGRNSVQHPGRFLAATACRRYVHLVALIVHHVAAGPRC